jgi:hypothetical protein
MIDVPNLFKSIVESLSPTIKINSITNSSGVYTVITCDTIHINVGRKLVVNGVSATVISFVKNTSFTFSFDATAPDTVNEIKIAPFNFFYGTQKMTKEELDYAPNNQKIPFVWFYSVYDEKQERDEFKLLGQSASVRLFVLDNCNYTDWLSMEHHNEVIVPLSSYVEELLTSIESHLYTMYNGVKSVDIRKHANWGVFVQKGHIEKIFSDDLSGIEVSFDVDFKKLKNCNC